MTLIRRALRSYSGRAAFVATLTMLAALQRPAHAAETEPWGPVASLRDDTNTHATNKPAGGWYVSPIHAVLRARDGKVVITGTERIDPQSCNGTTHRNYGLTFVLDPAKLDAIQDGASLPVQPIAEAALDNRVENVLYCSGHIPLTDGRILYVGGTDYPRALPIITPELGLNYSRVFDPETDTFTRVSTPMKGGSSQNPGMKWYPTNRMLPDGRVLIMGGYHYSVSGTGDKENRSLEIFDPAIWEADPNANPYTVLTQHDEITGAINGAGRAFTHVFLLPKPVPAADADGLARTVALIGSVGQMWLFNHEPGPSGAERMLRPSGGTLPNPSGADKAEGSTSVMLPDGKVMIMGGGRDGAGAAIAHFYDPYEGAWEDLDLGIARNFPIATWLPDGTVLLLNGYTSETGSPWGYMNAPGGADGVRRPQIIDPFKKTVSNEDPWPENTARGYHSFALLLKDGRVLIGGGKDDAHDTGCEKNEARIYTPPYLAAGARPAITNVDEAKEIVVGGAPLTIEFTGTVRAERGVALMASGAVTHSYNQNQLYLPLRVVSGPTNGSITVAPPATLNEAPPGEYLLHIISEQGAPSVGVYVRVVPPPACVYPLDVDAGVFIEAEGSSRRAGPFQSVDEMGRGNDKFIQVDPAATDPGAVPDEGNVMWYDLDVAEAGSAYLWLLGNGPATTSDTVFVSINGGADQVVTLALGSFAWTRAETALELPAGKQTLKIKAGKPGAKLDRIWLTGDAAAAAPTGLGDAPPETPCSKGQVTDPGGAGGSGVGGGAAGGGGTMAAAGSAGHVGVGGSSGPSTGGSSSGGVNSGGPTTTPSPSDDGCGCRIIASSSPTTLALAWLGVLSAVGVAAARRGSRTGTRRSGRARDVR